MKNPLNIYSGSAQIHNNFFIEVKNKFKEICVLLNLNECKFILGIHPQNTSNIIQFLMLVAKYYINMCKGTHRHFAFLEYKINVQSILQSDKQIALENNRKQIKPGHLLACIWHRLIV